MNETLDELQSNLEILIEVRDKYLRHTANSVRARIQKRIDSTYAILDKASTSDNQ